MEAKVIRSPFVKIMMGLREGVEFLPDAIASFDAQTHRKWFLEIGVNGTLQGLNKANACTRLSFGGPGIMVHDLTWAFNKPQAMNWMARRTLKRRYIAICDVDDLWYPEKLKKQLAAMEDGWDVVGTQAEYFGTSEGPIDIATGEITFDMLLEKNHLINSSVMMRPECAVWEDTDGLDDYPLWLKLAHEGKKLCNLPETLTKIRCHENQWFAGARDNSREIREHWRGVASC